MTGRPRPRTRRHSTLDGLQRLGQALASIDVGYADASDDIAVYISKPKYVMFWTLVAIVRLGCIFFLAATARLYWFMAHPYMSYYASLLGPSAVDNFKPIGVCFGLVAVSHSFELGAMVFYTIRARRLVFGAPPSSQHKSQDAPANKGNPKNQLWMCPTIVAGWIKRQWARLNHRQGFFGVESEFFHARFVSRELIEIVSQSAQVFKASELIGKVWINNLFVAIMVVNCWSTPVIQIFLRATPALERLVCLVFDLVLDLMASILIPLVIFHPYYKTFDFESFNFEISYLYDDIWFANMVMENKQLFALTAWDFVWKIVPHLSIFSCLSSVKALIRPASSQLAAMLRIHRAHSTRAYRLSVVVVAPSIQSRPDGEAKVLPTGLSPQQGTSQRKRIANKGERILTMVNACLLLWGMAILILHVRAALVLSRADVPACKQSTRPWLATKFSCSVLQFNCHRQNTTGVTNADLDLLEETSVVALVFSHCPRLHVPTQITKFTNLLGLDIFNSTIVEWTKEAAITNITNPLVAYIIFVRVNMTAVPEGVLQTLPDTMTDFEISVSNITELPDDLHERWHPMALFYVEHTAISTFPPTLMHLQVDDLSLIGSQITELPEFPVSHPGFFTLAMTHTPLAHLPESLGDPSAVGFLNLGYTQLRSLPAWVLGLSRSAEKVYLHHTPFCVGKSEEDRAVVYGDDAVLTCGSTGDRPDGKYPLAIMAPRRPW